MQEGDRMATEVLQGTLVLPEGLVERGQLVIEDGLIAEIVTDEPRHRPTFDAGEGYIAPGLIDLHVHGIAGADVLDGTGASLDCLTDRFAAHGVTGFLATTVTASLDALRHTVTLVRDYMASPREGGAAILGVHLEGPWISPQFKGVQNEAHIIPPDVEAARDLLRLGDGVVKRVSLAPELPGADRLIRMLHDEGVYVSIAHTGGTYEQALGAVRLGATHVTHCFNAMTPLHHRRPGVAGAAMVIDDLYTELIADGIHVHPAVMRLLIRVKGRDRVMLVTDAMSAADLADGVYQLGGKEVFVRDGEARLADGTLASSTLTMDAAVRTLVRLCGVPIADAVYMASTTPADAMGWGASKGKLRVGYDADVIALDAALQPMTTWVRGRAAS